MTDAIILHQYELSPFSEKVRRMLAFKQLPWLLVRAPAVMPKPDLVTLTGGYRKIPVLQVGNHVYCDTARIAERLERERPEPTLYPHPLARVFAEWADSVLFESTVPMIMRPTRFDDLLRWLTPEEQRSMLEDRKAMRKDATRTPPGPKTLLSLFSVYVKRLEDTLCAREYLLESGPCIADFSAYHSLWIVEHLAPERLSAYPRVRDWMARIAAIPDPTITPITAERAIEIAKGADPEWTPPGTFEDPLGFPPGTAVAVRASDYGRDSVTGELVHSDAQEIVLRREDARAGRLFVHFPRVGFEVTAA